MVLFLLIVGVMIGANIWVQSYLRSDAFRAMIEHKTGLALKLKAKYRPFQWSGSSVYSDQFAGGEGTGDISAQRIRASFNLRSILDGAWRINDLNIGRLDTVFSSKPAADHPIPPPDPVTGWRSYLPHRFELDRITIGDANFTWGTNSPGSGALQGTALNATPANKGWNITAKGGKLLMKKFPELSLQDAKIRTQQGSLYITESHLRTGENGNVQISGERSEDGDLNMEVQWEKVPAQSLLKDPWDNRLSGTFEGNAKIKSTGGSEAVIKGKFLLTDGLLQGIPMQTQIANYTRQPEYERLPLQQLSADYVIRAGKVFINNLVAESKGLLRVEGECIVDHEETITGTFKVGVTSQSLRWLPGSQARVFTVSQNGYLWATVHVGGTLKNPHEDLSSRLIAAATGQVIDSAAGMIVNPVKTTKDVIKDAAHAILPGLSLP